MIFYLIYLSSATNLFSEKELSEILTTSRIKNTSKDITGLLLYNNGKILQVLEGDEETVMNVYFDIEQDNRHRGIIRIFSGKSEERNFPDWSMGFKAVSEKEWNELSGYLQMDSSNINSKSKNRNKIIDTLVNSYMKTNVM